MRRHPTNHLGSWTGTQVSRLKRLSKQGTVETAAKNLGRTPGAVQQKAMRLGISFRAGQRAALRRG